MGNSRTVVGSKGLDDVMGPALRESGLVFKAVTRPEEASKVEADCFLIDARQRDWADEVTRLKAKTKAPILSMVRRGFEASDVRRVHAEGATGYVGDNVPPEEVAIRIRAMLEDENPGALYKEARGARRVWFQSKVSFWIFDREYSAWSTTLSETGIFLHTPLTFPLYSVIHMKFELLGAEEVFECDGVIVRQESEGPIRGVGVMFQNLKGNAVLQLEAFLQLHR